jgi:PAS domain S-box-containing protein
MPAKGDDPRLRQQAAVAELGQGALAAVPLEDLLEEGVEAAARELGTELASVLELTPDGGGLTVRAGVGWPPGIVGSVIPADRSMASGYALDADDTVIVEDYGTEERFGPSPVQRELGVVSAMVAQVGPRSHRFGLLAVHSRSPHHFTADDAHFLRSLANVVAVAARRIRAEDSVRASGDRFRELADNVPVMLWTTDHAGRVTFVNESWLRYTGTTLEEEVGESWTLGVHPDDEELMISSWEGALARREPWEHEYRLRRHDGEYHWIVDRGQPRYEGDDFVGYVGSATDIHERRLMEERLRKVYEREHHVAETLQRSLLPERLPRIDGVELAARYIPAGTGAGVGGDWYDAIELRDGRVAVVVGDVVGHGLRAAAVMGQLRNACRAYALVETSPAEVMARLNRLVTTDDQEVMATVLYLVLDRETGEVVYTSAGHPPPVVVSADGATFLDEGRSVPIGAVESAVFREATAMLPEEATLFLYTDGLVERRDVSLDDRLAQLRAAATAAGGDLPDVCEQVLLGVLGTQAPLDDVALLAVRPAAVVRDRLELTLPAEPESLVGLRRRLGRFLHAAGASDHETFEITLTISEAAGNAIEHAYGPGDADFVVEAAVRDGEVVASVRDSGSWREQRDHQRGRGLRIIEGLMDDVEVERAATGTVVTMRRRLNERAAA